MMNFVYPSAISTLAFLLILAAVLAAAFSGMYLANKHEGLPAARGTALFALGLFGWITISSLPIATGWIEAHPFPGVPLFFASVNLAGLAFALSPLGKRLASGLPLAALVGFQAFRLPLELVLHSWALQGTIPETMTWSGQNLDILTGIAALLAAPFAGRHRGVAWAFNALGLGLLLNVGRVAMFSSPVPFAWDVTPKLQLAMHLPFAWIGTICVAGALAGHVILTRALLQRAVLAQAASPERG